MSLPFPEMAQIRIGELQREADAARRIRQARVTRHATSEIVEVLRHLRKRDDHPYERKEK